MKIFDEIKQITNESFSNTYNEDDVDICSESAMIQLYTQLLSEMLNPDEYDDILTESTDVTTEDIMLERSIVKLDKKAKLKGLYRTSLIQIAREEKDNKFPKLLKLWKLEKAIIKSFEGKYSQKAKKRAMALYKRALLNKKRKTIGKVIDRVEKSGLIPNQKPKNYKPKK